MAPNETASTGGPETIPPITYEVDPRRLQQICRRGVTKSFGLYRWLHWALLTAMIALGLAMIVFPSRFNWISDRLAGATGLPASFAPPLVGLVILVVFIASLTAVRRGLRQQVTNRIADARRAAMTAQANGVHIETSQIAYHLKWPGIHHAFSEPDGTVLVHGGLFFFIPDAGFANESHRSAFLRHLIDNLSPEARERSEKDLQIAR